MSQFSKLTYEDPKSPLSEAFRSLRTNIHYKVTHNDIKTIMVTSTMPGEGKSWVVCNLAITFAQAGKKVIIIDGDMRKEGLTKIFINEVIPGLSDYLSDYESDVKTLGKYLFTTEIENLMLLPGGSIAENPSELLTSNKMKELIEGLKSYYDIIIVDGTPVQLVTDSVIISRLVDTSIIVTAYNQTKKAHFAEVIKEIENVGGNIGGIILNKVPIRRSSYGNRKYIRYDEYNTESKAKKNMQKAKTNMKTGSEKVFKIVSSFLGIIKKIVLFIKDIFVTIISKILYNLKKIGKSIWKFVKYIYVRTKTAITKPKVLSLEKIEK